MNNPFTSMPNRFSLTARRRMKPLMETKSTLKAGMCFMWCSLVTCGYWLHIRTSTATKLLQDGLNQLQVLEQCTRNVCSAFQSVLGKTAQHFSSEKLSAPKGNRSKPRGSAGLFPEPAGIRSWAFLIHLLLLNSLSTSFCLPCTLLVAKIITHTSQVFQSTSETFEWGLNELKFFFFLLLVDFSISFYSIH